MLDFKWLMTTFYHQTFLRENMFSFLIGTCLFGVINAIILVILGKK